METNGKRSSGRSATVGSSTLRYPLRSATKPKEGKQDASNSAAAKRGKPSSAVTQSMNVLDLSRKDHSAKPPRRPSMPTKSVCSPHPAPPVGSVTPVTEIRARRNNTRGKSDTPSSDAPRSWSRRSSFNALSSVSYWLTQIKLAEAASKHSISLGFFKLAMELGCEHFDRMREELRSYVIKHKLATELGDSVKDLLQIYNIADDLEKVKVSETNSQPPKEGKSEKETRNTSAVTRRGNLKPKSLNSNTFPSADLNRKEGVQKKQPASRVRGSYNKNPVSELLVKDSNTKHTQKKTQKQRRGQSKAGNEDISLENKPNAEAVALLPKEVAHEDKENMVCINPFFFSD
uniref:Uncharacterized protein n=1 Tax=Ananas comosus var. bracteatus TaxID=296719 RepID=A0A6V7QJ63_ANACO|nr:unnamed protein product [Ananas comosus var. bracteatus]